jgi:LemA protein
MAHERRTPTARALIALVVALCTGLFALISGCSGYDELVNKDAMAAEKWANVQAQLQRRHDLVPQLVSVVRGSAKHERETLDAVMDARQKAGSIQLTADDLSDPERMAALQKAQDELSSALSRLLVIQEAYPDLKANQSLRDLQVQLEGTENRLLRAREEYNAAARDYNATLHRIRGQVVNKTTGKPFKPRQYFEASPSALVAPEIEI